MRSVKENIISSSRLWVGDLEFRVLSCLVEAGRPLFLREIAEVIGVNVRRVFDALWRLVNRGIVERVYRGLYKLKISIKQLLNLKVRNLSGLVKENTMKNDGTREASGVSSGVSRGGVGVLGVGGLFDGGVVVGLFFDNVRGFNGLGYVCGDRGRVLGVGDLVFFDSVSYAEVLCRVRGFGGVPGLVAVYTNSRQDGVDCVRVEWRPPKNYVKRNGLASAVRMYFEVLYNTGRAVNEVLLKLAPRDVVKRWLGYLKSRIAAYTLSH